MCVLSIEDAKLSKAFSLFSWIILMNMKRKIEIRTAIATNCGAPELYMRYF